MNAISESLFIGDEFFVVFVVEFIGISVTQSRLLINIKEYSEMLGIIMILLTLKAYYVTTHLPIVVW